MPQSIPMTFAAAIIALPALVAPTLATASTLTCTFTKACSAAAGGCEGTKVSYGLTGEGASWTVTDVFNGVDITNVSVETLDEATSLRWRAGGVWRDELALTEIVLAANGAAALSSIGMNNGDLGATVMTGRCEKPATAAEDR